MNKQDPYIEEYERYRYQGLNGRYVNRDHLLDFYRVLAVKDIHPQKVGVSVNEEVIDLFRIGNGPVKVLMWSQMHGNESTTTRALTDLLHYMISDSRFTRELSQRISLYIIPMLSPDGARAYTRVNANNVDLNRDAQDRTQPESRVLRKVFEEVKPDFCFNLHDQRTIFSAGPVNKPATISFLSPSYNKARDINEVRSTSMKIIANMNSRLQEHIPGQVGRYDDGFNLNCVGDTFQSEGVPTILFEAGHFPDDYQRHETRKYISFAIKTALESILNEEWKTTDHRDYFDIPENEKLFCDILIKNVPVKPKGEHTQYKSLHYMYKETLKDGEVVFIPEFSLLENTQGVFAHRVLIVPDDYELEYSSEQELQQKSMSLLFRIL
ncbi:DUF2817 domain-containing protein [Robertkochia marina]|uniref:DUF2817 domain-containing protein n=1 Tax=Robertkochia marina TaxID=1227945 RepID=A0A4V3UY61_9FLAO|nr:M14 metallopeptidase family protein [Robertkochia marina]THD67866.1 DUF2817 domain-containing protein [Robertkochia marina]TRZ42095.1 DUF2817 domain-containing protein [Robertkochia marina]